MKGEGDERLEAARLVLDVAQSDEVLQALLDRLHMTVEHRRVRAYAERMCGLHRLDPLGGRRLLWTDDRAHAIRENLRAAARKRRKSRLLQKREHLLDAFSRHLGKMHDLNGRKRLDVGIGQSRLDLAHNAEIVVERLRRMKRRDDVDFAEPPDFLRLGKDARDVRLLHHIAMTLAFRHLKGAQGAARRADIRQIDMAVHIKKDAPAARAFLRTPRRIREKKKVVLLVERQGVRQAQPLPLLRLAACSFQYRHRILVLLKSHNRAASRLFAASAQSVTTSPGQSMMPPKSTMFP